MPQDRPALPTRRVTGTDVARRVGVDRSTVSLVLGGKATGRVAPEVQAAVRRAAEELGYRPDPSARALRLGRAEALALVVPQVTNPFFAPLLHGATLEARQSGYAVVLVDADDDGPRAQSRLIDALARQSVSGLLLWTAPTAQELAAWRERLVLVEVEVPGVAGVLLDVEQGAREVARHLQAHGHTRIGYLKGTSDHPTFARRQAALLSELGREFAGQEAAPFELKAAETAAARLLANPTLTAVVCDDDLLAAGVYRAARALGRRIPNDLSVVGFNDVDLAQVLDPELTTVAADAASLGAHAVSHLLSRLLGEPPITVRVPTRLVVRASTGPAHLS